MVKYILKKRYHEAGSSFVGINPKVAAGTLLAVPFPKLSHGSSTSQSPDR